MKEIIILDKTIGDLSDQGRCYVETYGIGLWDNRMKKYGYSKYRSHHNLYDYFTYDRRYYNYDTIDFSHRYVLTTTHYTPLTKRSKKIDFQFYYYTFKIKLKT